MGIVLEVEFRLQTTKNQQNKHKKVIYLKAFYS